MPFAIPILNGIGNSEGMEHDDDGFEWKETLLMIAYIVTLITLVISAIFQIHIVLAISTLTFVAYAILSPRVFSPKELNQSGDGQ